MRDNGVGLGDAACIYRAVSTLTTQTVIIM